MPLASPAPPAPRQRPGKATAWLLVAGAVAAVMAVGCCGLVGFFASRSSKAQKEALAEADRLYATDKAAAARKYKEGYAGAGDRKAEVLARIVDHEATVGDTAEARKWVDRGISDKVSPAYQTAVARELAAAAQREAADRHEAQQAAKDQKAQQRADERAGRDTVRANKELSRDKLRDLLSGRTQQQVLDALGKPDETQDVEGFAKMWYYHGAGVDPVTGRKAAVVQVVFDGGVVSLVNFN